jgi:P4 family phage/plasmid primase-like protien
MTISAEYDHITQVTTVPVMSYLIGDGDIIELRMPRSNRSVYVSSMHEAQEWLRRNKGTQVMINPHLIKPQMYTEIRPAGTSDILEYRYVAIRSERLDEILDWIKPSCYLKSSDTLLVPVSGVTRALILRVINSLRLVFPEVKEANLVPLETELTNPPDVQVPVTIDWLKSLVIDVTTESDTEVNILQVISELQPGKVITREIYRLDECPICDSDAAYVGKANGSYFYKCSNGCTWKQLKGEMGLDVTLLEHVETALRKFGKAALDMPEVQNELTILKATQEIQRLDALCHELYIPFTAVKAATRRLGVLAHEVCDSWIADYHLKTDSVNKTSIYEYQDGVYVNAEDHLKSLMDVRFKGLTNSEFIENLMNYIRRRTLFEFTDIWLALDNVMLNPATLETEDFNPDVVTRYKLDVAYDPDTTCPGWTQFLAQCQADGVLLQETAGYPLIPGYPIHKAVILLGQGGQGKSVFMNVIRSILRDENMTEVPLQAICSDKFASAELYGKLANFAGDIDSDKLMDSSTFKSATGEDPLYAQRKKRDPFYFVNRAKLAFSCNALPPTNDKTVGFYRRWVIIDFNRSTVTDINTHLATELLQERSGIFNWMLEGARRLRANQAFTYTSDVHEMEETYDARAHPIKKFLSECCKSSLDKTAVITVDHMIEVYNVWRMFNPKAPSYSRSKFVAEIQDQNVVRCDYVRVQWLNSRTKCFTGINFKSNHDLPLRIRVAMQKTDAIYISAADYNQRKRHTENEGLTPSLESSNIDSLSFHVTIAGDEHEIFIEIYPVLKESRIWMHKPECWGEGDWIEENSDFNNYIDYCYPDCPLTGKTTWISIDPISGRTLMWFNKELYENRAVAEQSFKDYDDLNISFNTDDIWSKL